MSDTTALPAISPVANPIPHFLRLTRTWLTAPDRGDARMLILLLLILTGVQVGIQILFNLWNRDFFNALENRDGTAFQAQIMLPDRPEVILISEALPGAQLEPVEQHLL